MQDVKFNKFLISLNALIPLAYLKNTLIIANPYLRYKPDSSTSERMPISEFTVAESPGQADQAP